MRRLSDQILGGLASWLAGSDAVPDADLELAFESTWSIPSWIPLSLFLGASAIVIYLYLFTRLQIPKRWRIALATLRIALVMLAIGMMFGLSVRRYRTDVPDLVLLLDDSASMTTIDRWNDPKFADELAQFIAPAKLDELSRFAQAQGLLARNAGQLINDLHGRYRLKLHRLSNRSGEIESDSPLELLTHIQQATAEHPTSELGDRVREIIDGQRGRPTAAIVIMTDGITTLGRSWDDAAHYARSKGMPLYLIGFGNDKPAQDIELKDLLAEDTVYLNDILDFAFSAITVGYEGHELVVRLRRDGDPQVLAQTVLTAGADHQSVRGHLRFRATEEGLFDFVVETVPREGEADVLNNTRTVRVEVRKQTIRVLLVANYPNHEFRFLKSVLGRASTDRLGEADNPIDLQTLLQEADPEHAAVERSALRLFPVQRDELFAYDVLIIGDVDPSFWSVGVMENIVAFVTERGGGVILTAGPRFNPISFAGTPLEELLPADPLDVRLPANDAILTEPFRMTPTRIGATNPVLQLTDDVTHNGQFWQQLPPLHWLAEVDTLKPGVVVLTERATQVNSPGTSLPVICLQFLGAGKVLTHWTDETYRWRYQRGDTYFARYWQQAIRFLSRANLRGNSSVELTSDRQQYLRGEPTQLRVRFLDDRLAPAANDGVAVMVEQSGNRKRRITLERTTAGRGIFEGLLYNLPEGKYHGWVVRPTLRDGEPTCDFEVLAPFGELARVEAATGDLRRAAEVSHGKYYDVLQAQRLLRDLPAGRHVRIEALAPDPIWNSWKVALLVVVLITTEWILRRRMGLV